MVTDPTVSPAGTFRPIQYLGSKRKLAPTIADVVAELVPPPGRVCDAFCGSGTVSYQLAKSHDVTAFDVQHYAATLARALLDFEWPAEVRADVPEAAERAFGPLLELEGLALELAAAGQADLLSAIIEHGSLVVHGSLPEDVDDPRLRAALLATHRALEAAPPTVRAATRLTRYFGGAYFSYRQGLELDALLRSAQGRDGYSMRQRTTLLGVTLSVLSAVVNTVGKQFAQPIRVHDRDGKAKPFPVRRCLQDRTIDVRTELSTWRDAWSTACAAVPPRDHDVVQSSFVDFFRDYDRGLDIVYADPPYTIDHYSRFYHVLETAIRGDEPPLATMRKHGRPQVMRGLYRADRHQSPFCVPSRCGPAFASLFEGVAARGASLVLSYAHPAPSDRARARLMSLDELSDMAKVRFRRVELRTIEGHAHRKLNRRSVNTGSFEGTEVFLLGRDPF